jgi:NhaA family Na+:H+ antiporter
MLLSNRLGIRNSLFYGVIGIGGVWLCFLLSGVHATIAAVLAAFTIPTTLEVRKPVFVKIMGMFSNHLNNSDAKPYHGILDHNEEVIYNKINIITKKAVSPLQRLEHKLHPVVAFIVMPIFALANAGVRVEDDIVEVLSGSVAMGVIFGLILGKVIGIVGFVYLFSNLKLFTIPETLTFKMILGVSFLAAIGFTMSLFITGLAFETPALAIQAKLGILTASLFAGITGFFLLKWAFKKQ